MAVRVIALLILTIDLQACATRGEVRALQQEVMTLGQAVRSVQAQQIAETTEESIRNDLKTLGGQALGLESRMADAAVEIGRLDARLSEAERATRANSSAVEEIRSSVEKLQALPSPPVSASPPEQAPRRPPPAPRGPEVAAPGPSMPPEQVYANALATFRAGEHGQAVLEFLDFIGRFPRHPLAVNAQYWTGEAYYAQRDYRQAIVELQKVLEHAPSNPKAADALLKIGMSYRALRDSTKAAQEWRRLVHDYPKSDAAAKAREFLHEAAATSQR